MWRALKLLKKKQPQRMQITNLYTLTVKLHVYLDLTKKQKRNKPLMNFLSVFMKKYEKTEEEDPKQPATTKGGKDKDK